MQTAEEILNTLKDILVDMFEVDADNVTLSAHLYDDLDIDSIDAVDLLVKLKEVTGKKIKPEDFKAVRTVEDIVNAIKQILDEND
jgi:acyl carrier protein